MRDKGDFAVGLLVGGLVGALIGLLLAPASGEETRRALGQRTTETAGRVREGAVQLAGRVREGAGQTSGRAMESAQSVGRRVRAQVDAMLNDVQQTVEDAVAGLAPADGTAPVLGEAAAAAEADGGEA